MQKLRRRAEALTASWHRSDKVGSEALAPLESQNLHQADISSFERRTAGPVTKSEEIAMMVMKLQKVPDRSM